MDETNNSEIESEHLEEYNFGTCAPNWTQPNNIPESESRRTLDSSRSVGSFPIKPTTLEVLEDSHLRRILEYLNYPDLMSSRKVSRRWNTLISNFNGFHCATVINLTFEHNNLDMMTNTTVPWHQAKLQFFDIGNSRVDPSLEPPLNFFREIVSLEFRQCFLSWTTLKKFIIKCPNLHSLIISLCTIHEADTEQMNLWTNIEEALFAKTLGSLQFISIHEVSELGAITRCLTKFILYCARNVRTLKISFHPFVFKYMLEEITSFYSVLLHFLYTNSTNLKNLVLDIRSTPVLSQISHHIFKPYLTMTRETLNLEVFKLTPPYPNCGDFGVECESGQCLDLFQGFLYTQKQLRSLAFPHFQYHSQSDNRRVQTLDAVSHKLEKLRVPGQIYLRRNFLKHFTNLKMLYIGEKCGVGRSAMLSPTRYIFDVRGGVARRTCQNFRHLSMWSRINYDSGKLYHIVEKFPMLTTFEFDGLRPVLNDRDMQAIIKFLPHMRNLSITSCDLISDYGVTGIPLRTCSNMNRLSTIYSEAEKYGKEKSPVCLSSLKGLQKLHLIGESRISDVGIAIAVRFLELNSLHVPWSERITDWGIKQIGMNNPSLESLTMSAAMVSTSLIGFTELLQTHPRIRHRLCQVHTIHMYQKDMISSPSLLTAILWEDPARLNEN